MVAIEFTPREMEIMANAWSCMSEEPKVNYKELSKLCGFTNDRSASNAWRAIIKKIKSKNEDSNGAGGEDGGEGDATPKATVTPKKRGRKAAATGGDDEESPTKKAKAGKGKKGKAAAKDDVDDEEVDKVKTEDGADEDDGELN